MTIENIEYGEERKWNMYQKFILELNILNYFIRNSV